MMTFPLVGGVRDLMGSVSNGVKIIGTNNLIKIGNRQFANSSREDPMIISRDFSDFDEQKLIEIGSDNRTKHLSVGSFPVSPFPVKGLVYGNNRRLMVPLVCRYNGNDNSKPFNVWFLVTTGSPITTLTTKSFETLVGQGFTDGLHSFAIQDPLTNIECQISKGSYSNVNLLGVNALKNLRLSIHHNWNNNTFELIQN